MLDFTGTHAPYRPLLDHLATHGCWIIAPHFERLISREALAAELLARPLGLVQALGEHAPSNVPVMVVGHSIGG